MMDLRKGDERMKLINQYRKISQENLSRSLRGGVKHPSAGTMKMRMVLWKMFGVPNMRENVIPVIRNYYIRTKKLHSAVRCVHLSDLHACLYGTEQKHLIQMIANLLPDAVLMSGDILEARFDKAPADALLRGLAKRWPCYAVMGNHEFAYDNYHTVKKYIRSLGISLLDGKCARLDVSGETVNICGVDDPKSPEKNFIGQLQSASAAADMNKFTILLTHRPEKAALYARYPFDLVLSGHAHGGQWRIPKLVNGVFAPNQGLFPQYAGGRYDFKHQVQIVNRGLAYHSRIPRFFNPPEIAVIDLVPYEESETV